jgi:hypothetical protein
MFATAQTNLGNATVGMATHGNDAGLFAEFSTRAVLMPFKTQEAGRPIYKDQVFITIHFPGDKTKRVERPVKMEGDDNSPSDPQRFPRQWQLFQNQQDQSATGMPITEWPPLTKAQALELKAIKIHTVEALAELPDTACTWLGARDLRKKAQDWLAAVADHAGESRLAAALEQRDATIAALQLQVDDLAERLAARTTNGAPDHQPSAAPAAPAKTTKSRAAATQE